MIVVDMPESHLSLFYTLRSKPLKLFSQLPYNVIYFKSHHICTLYIKCSIFHNSKLLKIDSFYFSQINNKKSAKIYKCNICLVDCTETVTYFVSMKLVCELVFYFFLTWACTYWIFLALSLTRLLAYDTDVTSNWYKFIMFDICWRYIHTYIHTNTHTHNVLVKYAYYSDNMKNVYII